MYNIEGFLTKPFQSQKCLQSNLTKKSKLIDHFRKQMMKKLNQGCH